MPHMFRMREWILQDHSQTVSEIEGTSAFRRGADLFAISALVLFLELACIRWFPAHVLFLTFFTNTVLLACFLGMSVGCLAASRRWNFIAWTPALLVVAMLLAHIVGLLQGQFSRFVQVGNQSSPQMVYFGTEQPVGDVAKFVVPIEVLLAFFFALIALAMLGPGQELGRALNRLPDRVHAYTLNILGSILGIVLFAAFSFCELPPVWWFLPVVLGLAYFVHRYLRNWHPTLLLTLMSVLFLAMLTSGPYFGHLREGGRIVGKHYWSPYYRIDYNSETRRIFVNLIGHQIMVSRDERRPSHGAGLAYAVPYLLRRDTGGRSFQDVLIIGAGSGNDVSRALQWGARHVDAVEIDPMIQRLGLLYHPDRPYQDARVSVHLDDGRNFLHSTGRQYDLIIFALVDSLVLHSSYSNIRLESYLFTSQAFADVRAHLKSGGVFVMYNYFRQGWIVARNNESLAATFNTEPLVFALPYQPRIGHGSTGGFTMFMVGGTSASRAAFDRHREYWLRSDVPADPETPNGFEQRPGSELQSQWVRLGLASVDTSQWLRRADDEWPFLYLRRPMIPYLNLRGMAIMGGLALLLILILRPKSTENRQPARFNGRMFFLGAGFMLIETKAVVQMALLFGSTWMVNTIVFFAVLVMILFSNLFVLRFRPERLWLYYAGLVIMLALNILVPLDFFLGVNRTLQTTGSCFLVFAPIVFAGVIFAVSFGRSAQPDQDFGANIAGAMLGGLSEYSSMLLGFKYLVLVAIAYYAASAAFRLQAAVGKDRQPEKLSPEPTPLPSC